MQEFQSKALKIKDDILGTNPALYEVIEETYKDMFHNTMADLCCCVWHIKGCGIWRFGIYCDGTFIAEIETLAKYSEDFSPVTSSFSVPISIPNIEDGFEYNKEEYVSSCRKIINWIRDNKEEALTFAYWPEAFIQKNTWDIPRFKFDCKMDLVVPPENYKIWNRIVCCMPWWVFGNTIDKKAIFDNFYKYFYKNKRTNQQLLNRFYNIYRKELISTIVKCNVDIDAMMTKGYGYKFCIYIDPNKMTGGFPIDFKEMSVEEFINSLDFYNDYSIEEDLSYFWNLFQNHANDIEKQITAESIFDGIEPDLDYKYRTWESIIVRPTNWLSKDIEFNIEKSIPFWLAVEMEEFDFQYYTSGDGEKLGKLCNCIDYRFNNKKKEKM